VDRIFLNNSAEIMLDALERIVHIFINLPGETTLSEVYINKGNGWMPYNGTIQVNGIDADLPGLLQPGQNVITLIEPFVGVGIYLKGYDFLNSLDLKILNVPGVSGKDVIIRGVKDITTDGTEILFPSPIMGSYEVAKLWCIDSTGVDRSVQFYNKTQNSFWAKSLRSNAKLCWIGFQT
jgi:hypothetical protein